MILNLKTDRYFEFKLQMLHLHRFKFKIAKPSYPHAQYFASISGFKFKHQPIKKRPEDRFFIYCG